MSHPGGKDSCQKIFNNTFNLSYLSKMFVDELKNKTMEFISTYEWNLWTGL